MKYPYATYKGKTLPIIPIELKVMDEWIFFDAYVDSGAAFSIFHADIAEILELDVDKGKESHVIVGDGSKMNVFMHELMMRLANTEFKTMIGFSYGLGIGFNILGQENIFMRFKICFDRQLEIIEFFPKMKNG